MDDQMWKVDEKVDEDDQRGGVHDVVCVGFSASLQVSLLMPKLKGNIGKQ